VRDAVPPGAGTVKAGGCCDVPLHDQIIEQGFVDVVRAAAEGPLFHNETDPLKYKTAAKIVGNKLSDWLRTSGLTPKTSGLLNRIIPAIDEVLSAGGLARSEGPPEAMSKAFDDPQSGDEGHRV